MALLNLGGDLVELLSDAELVFSPVLMDQKSIVDCDVALVEGSVRNEEDLEELKELRARSKTLVAFGTCAVFGGIPGLGSGYATLDLILKAYGEEFAPDHLPLLERRVYPIDQYVAVDYYLPGCPPPPKLLKDTLSRLLAGQAPIRIDLPVCAECKRKVTQEVEPEIKRLADTAPDMERCFLSQGYICLGSVSRNGCQASCPRAGIPCTGCRGPIDRVLAEPTHGILYDLTRRISHYTGKSEREVQRKLPDLLHSLYAYSLSVPEMRRKDAEAVGQLVHRISV
jgi:F420-non-reducing hydrogenase small subunit